MTVKDATIQLTSNPSNNDPHHRKQKTTISPSFRGKKKDRFIPELPLRFMPENLEKPAKAGETLNKEQIKMGSPKIPQVILIDISEQTYRQIIANTLMEQPPWARPFINQFFDWIREIKPTDVATALAQKKSLKDMYDDAPFSTKVSLGTVRTYLKVNPGMKQRLREGVKPQVIKYVLKFDNPQVHSLFMAFPDGEQLLERWISDSMEIIGATEATKTG